MSSSFTCWLGNWNESTVTATTLPPISGTVLDQKTITSANQGQVVTFNVSAALAGWRNNPAANFGIALVQIAPTPNLQLGSREGGAPAVLSIAGPAADNDVKVAPSGGDYTDPGSAANNALTGDKWCTSQTPGDCKIHVAAGVYRGGFTLPPGISLIGEEKGATILVGGLVAGGSLISDLTVIAPAGPALSFNSSGPATVPRLERISARGGSPGVALSGAGAMIVDSEIVSSTTGSVSALALDCEEGGSTHITRSRIVAIAAGDFAQGFSFQSDGSALQVEDSTVSIWGKVSALAFNTSDEFAAPTQFVRTTIDVSSPGHAGGFSGEAPALQLIDSQLNVQGGGGAAAINWIGGAVLLDGSSIHVDGTGIDHAPSFIVGTNNPITLLRSQVQATAAAVLLTHDPGPSPSRTVGIESSVVSGAPSVAVTGGVVNVSSSQLSGALQFQGVTASCVASFDASLAPLPAHCTAP
ncbi:MAG: hypothetical protein ABI885_06465 [Gammaproteobacteria bacterium]